MFFFYDFISISIILSRFFFILNNFQNNFGFQTSFKLISRILLSNFLLFFFSGVGGGGGVQKLNGLGSLVSQGPKWDFFKVGTVRV